jgi:hypothetical protein
LLEQERGATAARRRTEEAKSQAWVLRILSG